MAKHQSCCESPDPASIVTFNVGDVVQLKSGGPLMVIDELGIEAAICAWHHDGHIPRQTLALRILRKAEEAQAISQDYRHGWNAALNVAAVAVEYERVNHPNGCTPEEMEDLARRLRAELKQ